MPCTISTVREASKHVIRLGRRDGGRDYLRWYFTRPAVATAFAAEFGGTEIKASC